MVDSINLQIQKLLPGVDRCFRLIDKVIDKNEVVNYPAEFLNSLQPPGLPFHNIILKVGSPVFLMRNLEPPKLCNGTPLVVKQLFGNVI